MKSPLIKLCMVLLLAFLVKNKQPSVAGPSNYADFNAMYLEVEELGEANNFNTLAKGAVSYSLAGDGGYTLKEEKGYMSPAIMEKIPDKFDLPPPGPQENVEEVPSLTDYYDGSSKLNVVKIQCRIYSNPTDCMHQSACGWCGSSKTCILGNNLGPLQPCVKSSYLFSAPFPNWSPQAKMITEHVGGMSIMVVPK